MSGQWPPQDAAAPRSVGSRVAAASTHSSAVVAAGILLAARRPVLWAAALAFVGPLILWIFLRHARPFVAHHCRQALLFNASVALYVVLFAAFVAAGMAKALLWLVPVFLFAVLVLVVNWSVLTIVAIGRALRGNLMDYPLVPRAARRRGAGFG